MDEQIIALFQKAKASDQQAFSDIYSKYLAPIYRYIYFRVRSKTKADDLTQEVFIRFFEKIEKVDIHIGNPMSYFYTIARNMLIDEYRRPKIENITDEDAEFYLIDENNPEKVSIESENAKQLMWALKQISDLEAEVIIMKYLRGLNNSEISEILNKSEQAIRQLQSRGLKSLRRIYENI